MASDYLDGRLDVDASARIDTHLQQCRRCPPIAQALIGIKTALGLRPWTSAVPEQFVYDVAHLGRPPPAVMTDHPRHSKSDTP
ncbi:zf-HC2 domain-containing protein [Rhodococcus erythropolis]|uniref:zf-HC2 domain-containing protein n=1 Tax=Rhodococcus erythropolis TaxID=1833 RepID=UPI00210E86E8|nr:zf-HC2 domain-containing protein [Rhodococcus erythropolis]